MARASKFTDEQRLEIALDMLSGKMSVSEVCRKWDIGSTYAYKLKDRATELLRNGIGKPAGRPSGEVERLRKKICFFARYLRSWLFCTLIQSRYWPRSGFQRSGAWWLAIIGRILEPPKIQYSHISHIHPAISIEVGTRIIWIR